MAGEVTIGIDLGTSSCSAGVFRDGQFEIFKDEKGHETTPSYVAFTQSGRLIGQEAKDQVTVNPENTVYGTKRLIGKLDSSVDDEVQRLGLPFKTNNDGGIESNIGVKYKGRSENLNPKQISAMLLVKMKRIAEQNMQEKVGGAVISVPAHFNSYQRQATIDAGKIAGFNRVNLVNEPTATAIAISSQISSQKWSNFLVADFGGGFFSLTAARMKSNGVEILASCGDDFGGLDIDKRLFEWCLGKIKCKYSIEVKGPKCTERLKQACEKAKKQLSHSDTTLQLEGLTEGTTISLKVTKEDFNIQICEHLREKFQGALSNLKEQTKKKQFLIEKIIPAGRCWQANLFKDVFLGLFGDDNCTEILSLDNPVLLGLSFKAATAYSSSLSVKDVTHRSVMYSSENQQDRKANVVFTSRQPLMVESDNCNVYWWSSVFKVFEEVNKVSGREKLTIGQMIVASKKSWYEKAMYVQVNFRCDNDGILGGNITDYNARIAELAFFHRSEEKNSFNDLEIQFQDDENEAKVLENELSNLESLCFSTKRLVTSSSNLTSELKERLEGKVGETLTWKDDSNTPVEGETMWKKLEKNKIVEEVGKWNKFDMSELMSGNFQRSFSGEDETNFLQTSRKTAFRVEQNTTQIKHVETASTKEAVSLSGESSLDSQKSTNEHGNASRLTVEKENEITRETQGRCNTDSEESSIKPPTHHSENGE